MLSFWVGRWRVVGSDGTYAGENTIEEVAGGAALVERWRGAGGDEGVSLFYNDGSWKQVWVQVGCVKVKTHDSAFADGVRFVGTAFVGGKAIADRTTLTELPGTRVRQVIEHSHDGDDWVVSFDAIYERAG